MNDLLVQGLSRQQLYRRHRAGTITKICANIYTWREPTVAEMNAIVGRHWKQAALTGPSAASVYLGTTLSFPLHYAYPTRMPHSDFFVGHRSRFGTARIIEGFPVQTPIVATGLMGHRQAIALLSSAYAGPDGLQASERDLADVPRLPNNSRKALNEAAIGCDSQAERTIVQELKAKGLVVRCNHRIGGYLWGIVVGKIAVEIDGYAFHRELVPFVKDRWKGNDATLRGYTVLRYSGYCVRYHRDLVVDQIYRAARNEQNFDALQHHPLWNWHYVEEMNRLNRGQHAAF